MGTPPPWACVRGPEALRKFLHRPIKTASFSSQESHLALENPVSSPAETQSFPPFSGLCLWQASHSTCFVSISFLGFLVTVPPLLHVGSAWLIRVWWQGVAGGRAFSGLSRITDGSLSNSLCQGICHIVLWCLHLHSSPIQPLSYLRTRTVLEEAVRFRGPPL